MRKQHVPPHMRSNPASTQEVVPIVLPSEEDQPNSLFTNVCAVNITANDVNLKFGIMGKPGEPIKVVTAVAMSHATFEEIANNLNLTVMTLQELHGGSIPRMGILDIERIKDAQVKVEARVGGKVFAADPKLV